MIALDGAIISRGLSSGNVVRTISSEDLQCDFFAPDAKRDDITRLEFGVDLPCRRSTDRSIALL